MAVCVLDSIDKGGFHLRRPIHLLYLCPYTKVGSVVPIPQDPLCCHPILEPCFKPFFPPFLVSFLVCCFFGYLVEMFVITWLCLYGSGSLSVICLGVRIGGGGSHGSSLGFNVNGDGGIVGLGARVGRGGGC